MFHLPFRLRGSDKRSNLARGRKRPGTQTKKTTCKTCAADGKDTKARYEPWCKGLCKKHARQQGLRPPHEGSKKGLSKNRKAKGKKPKGRLMSIAEAVRLKIVPGREAASCHPRERKATERKLKGRSKAPATTSVRKEGALDRPREASPNVEEAFWSDAEEGAAVEEDMDIRFVGMPKIPKLPTAEFKGKTPPWLSLCIICLAV